VGLIDRSEVCYIISRVSILLVLEPDLEVSASSALQDDVGGRPMILVEVIDYV
jgi:hypothetical protein